MIEDAIKCKIFSCLFCYKRCPYYIGQLYPCNACSVHYTIFKSYDNNSIIFNVEKCTSNKQMSIIYEYSSNLISILLSVDAIPRYKVIYTGKEELFPLFFMSSSELQEKLEKYMVLL